MTYYDINPQLNTSLVYGEGLRVPNTGGMIELDGLFAASSLGKKKSFDRVSEVNKLRVSSFTSDQMPQLN